MPLSYLQWNDILAKYYFNEEKAGQEVILFANEELITKLGNQNGSNFEEFKQQVINGPGWVKTYRGICDKAYYTCNDWRSRSGLSFPPYIVYLVFFVYVATVNGEFDSKAYYPRLRSELGEESVPGAYPHFDKVDTLWMDLQEWANIDKKELLGRYTFRRRFEAWKHVGIPLSQILLSDEEKEKLPLFFSRAGFDPSDLPSDDTIIYNLKNFATDLFQRRTVNMIQGRERKHEEFRNALVDIIITNLAEWDGTYEEIIDTRHVAAEKKEAPSNAILGFKIDSLSGSALFNLRIKSKKEFPDTPLVFRNDKITLSCRGAGSPEWSTPLNEVRKDIIKNFNPVTLDWTQYFSLDDPAAKWSMRFKGSLIRIFVSGQPEGLPGWIEVQRVKAKTEYFIFCHNSLHDDIFRWGGESHDEFQEREINGIPARWNAFFAKNINNSHPNFGVLALPKQSRVFLEGGIRIGRSNHFIAIAPPSVRIDSRTGDDLPFISGTSTPLNPTEKDPTKFSLPHNLPLKVPICIELHDPPGNIIQKRTIFLERMTGPVPSQKSIALDPAGRILHLEEYPWAAPLVSSSGFITGATVKRLDEIDREFHEPVNIDNGS